MYVKEEKVIQSYTRTSKLGVTHHYQRVQTLIHFRCDNCSESFVRPKGEVSPKRLSNNYFHCCSKCDSKRFAQKKGVEQKKIWDLPASSTLPINRF